MNFKSKLQKLEHKANKNKLAPVYIIYEDTDKERVQEQTKDLKECLVLEYDYID